MAPPVPQFQDVGATAAPVAKLQESVAVHTQGMLVVLRHVPAVIDSV